MTRRQALLAAPLALLAVSVGLAAAEPGIRVVSSDETAVVVRCDVGALTLDAAGPGDGTVRPLAPGFDRAGVPGAPDLPARAVKVAVPECERIDVRVQARGTRVLDGVRVSPSPSIVDVGDGEVNEWTWVEGGPYREDGIWPAVAARVSEPAWLATQRIVEVQFFPCQANPVVRELLAHESIEVTLTFGGVEAGGAVRGDLPRRESLLRAAVLNYESGRSWRRRRPAGPALGERTDGFQTSANWVRLSLEEHGVYRVTESDLADANVSTDMIDPSTFRVFFGGGLAQPPDVDRPRPEWMDECSILVLGESDGSFDTGDAVVFCAVSVDDWSDVLEIDGAVDAFTENRYGGTNVYWLTWEETGVPSGFSGLPRRMESVAAPGRGGARSVADYRDRKHFEVNVDGREGLSDNWFWFRMQTVGESENRYFHEILSDVVTDSTGLLRGRVDGGSAGFHRCRYYLNSVLADTAVWYGYSASIYEATGLPINEGYNTYRVLAIRDSTNPEDQLYIDWFDLEYWRRLLAVDGALTFGSSGRTGVLEYRVGGFEDGSVDVYRTADKYTASVLTDVSVEDDAGGYVATFADDVSDTASYEVVSDAGYRTPLVERYAPSGLRVPDGSDYIMIVHEDFYDQAVRLAQHRESDEGGSFAVRLVGLSDVYAEFSWGLIDPVAIRDFLKHTWDGSTIPPTHVLLVGDAVFDVRGYLPSSVECFIPAFYTGSSYWPTESWFVGFTGTTYYAPAMAIGRLSVRTESECRAMVDKILRYEAEPVLDLWRNHALIVADDEFIRNLRKREFMHTEDSEKLATGHLPLPLDQTKIYLMEYELDAIGNSKPGARKDFLDAWSRGAVIVNYTGHGGETVMTHENAFLFDDIPNLTNIDGLSLFFGASCRMNKLDMNSVDSLGEALAKSPIGGAIASIGSTRDSGATQNTRFNRAFYDALFVEDPASTTPALDIGSAFQAAFSTSGANWINDSRFAIIGDPAIVLGTPRGSGVIDDEGLEPMRRYDTVTVEGTNAGETAGEDGVALLRVYESADTTGYIHDATGPDDPMYHVHYVLAGERIFDGAVPVGDGDFDASFVVSSKAQEGPYARVRAYFYSDDSDGACSLEGVAIGDSVSVADSEGPDIELEFEGGGTSVLPGTPLAIRLSDESGLNLVVRDPDDAIVLGIDGWSDTTDVTEDFVYDFDDHTSGTLDYELPALDTGSHTIAVAASDNAGNRSTESLTFGIVSGREFEIRNVANSPNPFPFDGELGTDILFELSEAASVEIDIFTVGGRLVRHLGERRCEKGANQIHWDGLDGESEALASGVYLYRIHATSEHYHGDKAVAIGRAVVMWGSRD